MKALSANIEGYFSLMKKCIPDVYFNSGDLLEELIKSSMLGNLQFFLLLFSN